MLCGEDAYEPGRVVLLVGAGSLIHPCARGLLI